MLTELAAVESAYHALEELDQAGRRRALRWLTDALGSAAIIHEPDETEAHPTTQPLSKPQLPAAAQPTPSRAARPAPAGRRATARPAATASSPRRSRTRGKRQVPAATGERAYRRMPPAEQVLAAYRQLGTVSALAEHFDVPRHTVQGWARRLRGLGHQIGRQD
jgi:hypothetical protein